MGGIALLFIAPLFLVLTEVQGVKITRLIGRAQASTLSNIPSAHVDPSLDGFMIHTTGPLSVSEDASGGYTDKDTGVCFGSGAMAAAQINTANFAFVPRAGVGATQPLVPSNPLRIERCVEVYQWIENEEQDAHSTSYTYQTRWVEMDVPSGGFKMPGHANPSRMLNLHSRTHSRPDPCIGAFGLSKEAVSKADWWGEASVHPSTTLAPALQAKNARVVPMPDVSPTCVGIFIPSGNRPVDQFAVGDMRVTFKTVEIPATAATAVGVQASGQLRPYTKHDAAKTMNTAAVTPRGESDELSAEDARAVEDLMRGNANCCRIFTAVSALFTKLLLAVMRHVVGEEVVLLSPLSKSATMMFVSEQIRVERALSGFRILGTFLFILAFYLVLHPIAALFSFIPFLGKMISSLFLLAAIIVGLSCAVCTMVAAWLVVKPLRACVGFLFLAGVMYLEYYLEPYGASIKPVYMFGGLSAVAGALALYELYQDCLFQQAAKKDLATASYVQEGMPIHGGGASLSTNKEMV